MQFQATVKTRSKKFAIEFRGDILIHATETAKNNKVNIEIIKELTKIFNRRVSIKAGLTSRRKVIEVEDNESYVFERIRAFS